MKIGAFLVLLLLSIGRFSFAAPSSNFPPDDPPFYTMGWQELNDLTDKQKTSYIDLLVRDLSRFSIREKSSKDLQQAAEDNTSWEEFQLQIYDACHRTNSEAFVTGCRQLEKDRLRVLDSLSVDHSKHIRR